jgi:hypothetical protein
MGKIPGFPVAYRDRGLLGQEHHRKRLADSKALADDYRVFSFDLNLMMFEQPDDAVGSTGQKTKILVQVLAAALEQLER